MRERIEDAGRRMEGATKNLAHEFAALRTGRASTALLDRINVDAYGAPTPLPQLAKKNVAPHVQDFILKQGAEPALMDPRQFGAHIKAELAKWGKVVRDAGIKVD